MVRLAVCSLVLSLAGGCRGNCGGHSQSTATHDEDQAGNAGGRPSARPSEPNREVVDPYCGMVMRSGEAAATAVYRGKTYYFCLEDHRDAFHRDPERFLPSTTTAAGTESPATVTDGGPSARSPDSQK